MATAMRALMETVFDDYADILEGDMFRRLIRRNGCLYIYENHEELQAAKWSLDLRRNLGAAMEEIGGSEIRQLEPALNRRFDLGIFAPENGSTIDPHLLVRAMPISWSAKRRHHRQGRGPGCRDRASGAPRFWKPRRPSFPSTGWCWLPCLVVAARAQARRRGAAGDTARLSRHFSADPQIEANRTVMWNKRSVFVNPMDCGLRIAGTGRNWPG